MSLRKRVEGLERLGHSGPISPAKLAAMTDADLEAIVMAGWGLTARQVRALTDEQLGRLAERGLAGLTDEELARNP
jgi:phage FluMu protein gp41